VFIYGQTFQTSRFSGGCNVPLTVTTHILALYIHYHVCIFGQAFIECLLDDSNFCMSVRGWLKKIL